jgi:hypothetical protein
MNYGPTHKAIRYAVGLKLEELNDAIRLALLETNNVLLHASKLSKPNNKEYFATLELIFHIVDENKYITYEIGLSNKKLPVWFTQENNIMSDLYIVKIVDLWILHNVTIYK